MKKVRVSLFFIILLIGLFGFLNKDQIKLAVTQNIFNLAPVNISAGAAVLLDEKTGEILFSKNENERIYPASTTKLLTALVVLEKSSTEEKVKIGDEVFLNTEGEARVGLFEGQVQTVEELLAAMLLRSGNDAARSLAVYIAEKEMGGIDLQPEAALAEFANMMNEKALEIGAVNSHFTNPHGLHDPEHYSTANDLAVIATIANQNDEIQNLVSKRTYSTKTHVYTNRNKLLDQGSEFYYEYAKGMKTGFTDQAGYCLVSSAEEGGRQVIAVVLNAGKDTVWSDSISLIKYGLEREKKL